MGFVVAYLLFVRKICSKFTSPIFYTSKNYGKTGLEGPYASKMRQTYEKSGYFIRFHRICLWFAKTFYIDRIADMIH